MLEITVRKIASAPLLFAHKVSHLLSQRKAAKNRLVGPHLFCGSPFLPYTCVTYGKLKKWQNYLKVSQKDALLNLIFCENW